MRVGRLLAAVLVVLTCACSPHSRAEHDPCATTLVEQQARALHVVDQASARLPGVRWYGASTFVLDRGHET